MWKLLLPLCCCIGLSVINGEEDIKYENFTKNYNASRSKVFWTRKCNEDKSNHDVFLQWVNEVYNNDNKPITTEHVVHFCDYMFNETEGCVNKKHSSLAVTKYENDLLTLEIWDGCMMGYKGYLRQYLKYYKENIAPFKDDKQCHEFKEFADELVAVCKWIETKVKVTNHKVKNLNKKMTFYNKRYKVMVNKLQQSRETFKTAIGDIEKMYNNTKNETEYKLLSNVAMSSYDNKLRIFSKLLRIYNVKLEKLNDTSENIQDLLDTTKGTEEEGCFHHDLTTSFVLNSKMSTLQGCNEPNSAKRQSTIDQFGNMTCPEVDIYLNIEAQEAEAMTELMPGLQEFCCLKNHSCVNCFPGEDDDSRLQQAYFFGWLCKGPTAIVKDVQDYLNKVTTT